MYAPVMSWQTPPIPPSGQYISSGGSPAVAVPPETLSTVCANTSEGIRCRFGGPVVPLVSTHSPDEPSPPTIRAPAPADSSPATGSTAAAAG